jgi:hypothetical protein
VHHFSANPMQACSFLLPAILLLQGASAQPPVDPVSQASSEEVQNLLQWISQHTSGPAALSQDALNRTALRGLIQEGLTGATWHDPAQPSPPAPPALMARLGAASAYVRTGLVEEGPVQELRKFRTQLPTEVTTLILDLRAPCPAGALHGATLLTELFLPEKTPLFLLARAGASPTLQSTTRPPVWTRRLWLLIDERTPPPAELAAHLLVRHAGALSMGSATSGRLTEYLDRPLGAGVSLRLPSATVSWPDGTRLTGQPVPPAVAIPAKADAREALLSLSDPATLPGRMKEQDRPRFNEAALMAGAHPELITPGGASVAAPPDPVLQQALDLQETSTFLKLDAPLKIKRAGTGP